MLYEAVRNDDDEASGVWCRETNRLLRCAGCHSVSLQRVEIFSEDWDPATGQPEERFSYFPERPTRVRPTWLDDLPTDLRGLLDEIYNARDRGDVRLTAMGVRTVIDTHMSAEIGDIGGFEQKLERLVKDGFIGEKQRETLDAVVDAGSAAGHRGFKPSDALIDAMLDTVESLVRQRYVVDPMVKSLRATIPPRPPRPERKT